jgi:hypothetical protein
MKQRDAGKISKRDFDIAFDTMSDPRKADRVIARSSQEVGGFDWATIVEWISLHWVDILKVIVSIAFLFLEEEKQAKQAKTREFDTLKDLED